MVLYVAYADTAISQYSTILVGLYKNFKGAENELDDRILCIESICIGCHTQLALMQTIWASLDDKHKDLQQVQGRIMQRLVAKLEDAISRIEGVIKEKEKEDGEAVFRVKKLKYILWAKESIDKAIKDLQEWQGMLFGPSWYLMMLIPGHRVDDALASDGASDRTLANSSSLSLATAKSIRDSLRVESQTQSSVFRRDIRSASDSRMRVPFCTAEMFTRPNKKTYVLDSVACLPGVDINVLTKDVRDLARKLCDTDPLSFGLLRCAGVVRVFEDPQTPHNLRSFDFVFSVPSGLKNPQSLRSILLAARQDISLSSHIRIARQLAQSVSYVHSYGSVHKNIRPDTVLVLEDDTDVSTQPASFLLGFEKFRLAEGRTLRPGDSAWEQDLYRHPRRQGLKPEDVYVMQHDIYSLSVCLLEIALWNTFVAYPFSDGGVVAVPSPVLSISGNVNVDPTERAIMLKNTLVQIARKRLPTSMGDRYSAIVVSCLTCHDKDNLDFGDEFELMDEDGVTIGVRYIQTVSKIATSNKHMNANHYRF
jgi:hypothetical protein